MATRPNPTTCSEAAARFREWAEYAKDAHSLEARGEILESFGDAPVPAAILQSWDFTR